MRTLIVRHDSGYPVDKFDDTRTYKVAVDVMEGRLRVIHRPTIDNIHAPVIHLAEYNVWQSWKFTW